MTGRPERSAPGLAVLRVLLLLLPQRHREVFLGDLMEEYETFVSPGRSAAAARWWFWTTAMRGLALGFAHRVYDVVRRPLARLAASPHEGRLGGRGRGRGQMDILLQDLRYALRRVARSPGFTVVAVFSLALGIGANTAIFSMVNALLLKGLSVEHPEQLVEIYTSEKNGYSYSTSSNPDFEDLRDKNDVFSEVVAYVPFFGLVERGDEGVLTLGEMVSGNYFTGLGVRPVVGRSFLPEEDETHGTHPVIMLGHGYWQSVYDGDVGVLGQTLRIFGQPYTVVGVAPEGFNGMFPGVVPDLYAPLAMSGALVPGAAVDRMDQRGSRNVFLKGRLKEGVTAEQADQALKALSAGLAEEYPSTNDGRVMSALSSADVSIHPIVDGALVPVAGLLLTVVGMILLIACANLASFLLARGADRRKEIAVRLALGAQRWTLVRQLMTETVVLAVLGGLAGVVLANWTISILLSFQPPIPIPINLDLGIDRNVLAFTSLISLVAAMLFGLAPALQATRPAVASTLKDEAAGGAGKRRRVNLRNSLVVVQVALSFVLMIGAGLFVRSLQKASAIDTGFDTGPGAIIWPHFDMSNIEPVEGRVLQREMMDRIRSLPSVTVASLAEQLPLSLPQTTGVLPEGVDPPEGRSFFEVDDTSVDPEFFRAMGISVVRGRNFSSTDTPDSPGVVIVSEAFAARFWPGENPVGKTVAGRGAVFRVVGVASNTKVRSLGEAPRPYIYFNVTQKYQPAPQIVLRGTVSPRQLLSEARTAMRELRPDLVIMEAKTMDEHLALTLFAPRMGALLLGVFGALALLLSAIGIYGVVSYAVARRTREVGVRISLGATHGDVIRMVVGGGMRLVTVGGAIGLAASGAVTWLLSSFLYGIGTTDVATFVGIPSLLVAVAFLAAYLPARRAARVDPVEALRTE